MTGRVLDGRYRVGRRIARGGMATVYEAHDVRLDRVCAVKVMHTDLGDDHDFGARFVREAHAAARLSHPNVVAVTDQGDDGGLLFLVMELVPGRTLRDVVRDEAPMPPARALALLEPVLMALAEAHRCGLVHRDVKPENVLIADDGRVKVADFGLARAFDANSQHTATGGVLIGTVSYLAPELIVNGRADPRSDVYAAGVLLYEMLTGRKPHQGDGAIQIAFKHVNEDVPAPSKAGPDLPAYLDALVLRATARERERRPADAKVLLHQVRRVRAALEAGDLEDPDLTADLMPTVLVAPLDSIDYTDEADGAAAPRDPGDATTVIGPLVDPVVEPVDAALAPVGALAAAEDRGVAPAPARRGAGGAGSPPPQPPVPRQSAAPPARPGPPPRRRPARSRRGLVLLVVVALLTAGAVYAGWWFGVGRYTSTPGVINLSVAEAAAKAEAAGLELEVADEEYSETVTAGSVISTDPAAGSRIVEGGTVGAVVSLGPERYEVPRLRGRTLSEAEELLEGRNLSVGQVTRQWSDVLDRGVVISATPGAGTELRRDSAVALKVSRGPEPLEIVDFTGRDAERAEAELTEAGFVVERSEAHSDDVRRGRVVSQSPSSGTGFRGDVVELVVSKGPVMVEVPSLRTASIDDARAALAEAGLEIEVVRTEFYVGLDRVVRQSPGPGESIAKGSTVTVYVV
jgi:beta-lactam-binding protein with PASTA domain